PFEFANSVINAAAGQAAIWHGLRGVNSTVAAGEASGLLAIAQAAELVRAGRADALLAGGVEELCFESFLGYYRTGRLCGSGAPAGRGSRVPSAARRSASGLAGGAAPLRPGGGGPGAARAARPARTPPRGGDPPAARPAAAPAARAEVLGWGAAFAAEGDEAG